MIAIAKLSKEELSTKNVVYCAINTINGKKYIGRTELTLRSRILNHRSSTKKGKTKFHRAIREYGFKSFEWSIMEECKTFDDLCINETKWIKKSKSANPKFGYNIRTCGPCMLRTNIYLTDKQREDLKQQSNKTGLTVAELVRRAIDRFLRSVKRDR